jgi:phosphoglycolate phosphatase
MTLARPRAILMDWDDTLVDNWASIHAAMNATLTAMDREPWTLEHTRAEAHRSLRNSFPEIFGDRWEEAKDLFYSHFAENHLELLKPQEGAGAFLEKLGESGLFLAVVSNKTGLFLREEAEHLGWTRHFAAIVGATDAAEDKPAPAPVAFALKGSGIAPGRDVWFVGDGRVDMECARRAACTAVLLRRNAPLVEEFGDHVPDRFVSSFAELEALALAP